MNLSCTRQDLGVRYVPLALSEWVNAGFQVYGEDPHLTAELATAFVHGVQVWHTECEVYETIPNRSFHHVPRMDEGARLPLLML